MELLLNRDHIITTFKEHYKKVWESTPDTFPVFREKFSQEHQKIKEAHMNLFTDDMIHLVKGFSDKETEDSKLWGSSLKRLVFKCGTDILGLDSNMMKLLLDEGFCDVTSDFITQARDFDAGFKLDDIFQSLRNAWIMNCIQRLMGRKVEMTPSVFAYSMLYPYTDNYLDTPAISEMKKSQVNHRFERRLAGESLKPESPLENRIFRLVEMIEGQFGRDLFPMVYSSLLGIQNAQERSLQQSLSKTGFRPDILDISVQKGGSSVLADGCLIKGDLSEEEADFSFGFGVLLQFIDDLQDANEDKNNGHATIFSIRDSGTSAESDTNRLMNFINYVLDTDQCFVSSAAQEMKKMIKKSVLFLLFGAVACNSKAYGEDYLNRLEGHSPLSFRYLKRFHKKIGREYGKLKIRFSVKSFEIPMAKAFASGILS